MVYTIGGELYHHGVMGQKWGKRNGPPYPLKPEAHSDREKKFGYKKSIGGGRNEASYEKNRKKVNRVEKKTANTQGSAREVPSEKKGLSDEQKKTLKKIAVGTAIVAGAALTAYAAYKYSPQIKSAARNGKEIAAKYMKTTLSGAKSKIANSKVVTKLNKAKKTVSNAANQVSQSTAAASQAASKTHLEVPKATAQKAAEAKASISLKFSEQAQDSAEINRKIMENNKRLQQAVSKTVMSQQSYVDEGEDLVAQMLKKNAKKLGM